MNSLCYALLVAPALLTACGGSSTSDDMAHVVVTGDMTTTSDMLVTATGDMAHTASPDMLAPAAPPQVIEGCNAVDYIDMTGATGVIAVMPWNPSLGEKCLRVKSGAQVSWAASSTHPLEATTGSTPTPIPASPGVQTATTLTFSTAGAVYGWQCAVHTSLMHGAIWVE